MAVWHKNMDCAKYKRQNPNPLVQESKLKNLAAKNLWRQCIKCKHMIELATGSFHMTCSYLVISLYVYKLNLFYNLENVANFSGVDMNFVTHVELSGRTRRQHAVVLFGTRNTLWIEESDDDDDFGVEHEVGLFHVYAESCDDDLF
ncbi:IBR domain-containing protein [Artemisia annua]|uniref:IBR domain-containing protein n=1 Tax=Artemisia annua TaxID=35608 RepID=A0A2U1NV49_ARTAN|nr:IBR domain-containing protein [Artemisia annua]